ncbi:MAG: hypothetical protein EU530_04665 [Promethearchaeota archaeon]|nr:MAG: hypothetical protein EU530_04665 [Candidatus Lokiarchaeota archaeon]
MKEPIALILMMNKSEIGDKNILEAFQPYMVDAVKSLVEEGYIKTKDQFDKILDGGFVQAIRMEDADFKKLESDDDLVGATAMDVYKANYQLEPNEDVDILHYPKETAPWGFALFLAVMYSI